MADVNITSYGVNAVFEQPAYIVRKRKVDLAEAAAKKGSALAANDVIQAIEVQAGEIVVGGYLKVLTGNGASNVASVGDGDSTAGYLVGTTDINTVATIPFNGVLLQLGSATFQMTGGKVYAADDTIDIKLLAGGTVGSVGVYELAVYILQTVK